MGGLSQRDSFRGLRRMHAVRSREKKGEKEEDFIHVCGKRKEKEMEELSHAKIEKKQEFLSQEKEERIYRKI